MGRRRRRFAARGRSRSGPRTALVRSMAESHDDGGPPVFVAMDELVAQRALVRSTLRRCKIPRQDLADLVQIVYLGAFRAMSAGHFHPGSLPLKEALARWLVGISWRSAVRYHESPQRRDIPSSGVELEVEGPPPEARLEAREAFRELSALPGRYRAALVGAAMGHGAAEIARWLSVSHTSVSIWLREGRQALARRLAMPAGPRGPKGGPVRRGR